MSLARAYDEARTRFIEGEGFSLLRIWNSDTLSNADGALQAIADRLPQSGRGAR